MESFQFESAKAEKEAKNHPQLDEEDKEKEEAEKPKIPCDMENECRIRPRFSEKFRPGDVQKVIEEVMTDVLFEKVFEEPLVKEWMTEMVTRINEKVVGFGFPRYKTIVQVQIIETRGQSCISASRKFWDAATDSSATFTFHSVSLKPNTITKIFSQLEREILNKQLNDKFYL